MSSPLKQIIDLIQKPSVIRIGKVINNKNGRCFIKTSDNSYINAWGNFNKNDNVYIRDEQILGKIKNESYISVVVD